MKLFLPILLLVTSITAHADPFRDGVVAYQQEQYQQALDAWLPLAQSGHVLAQTLVGSMYAYGEGVKKNDHEAFKWLSLAAKKGSAQAQYNLGILYEKGFGTTENKSLARKWFKAAADQGRQDAADRYAALKDIALSPAALPILEKKENPQNNIPVDSQNIEEEIIPQQEALPSTPKKRIHIVLNKNNPELLGPPTISIEPTINTSIRTGTNVGTYGLAWARQQPLNNYTIQLASSIDPNLIVAFQTHLKLTTHYAKTISEHNNNQWHALIYGSYTSVSAAKKEMDKLPANWKTWQPWIKKFSSISAIKH